MSIFNTFYCLSIRYKQKCTQYMAHITLCLFHNKGQKHVRAQSICGAQENVARTMCCQHRKGGMLGRGKGDEESASKGGKRARREEEHVESACRESSRRRARRESSKDVCSGEGYGIERERVEGTSRASRRGFEPVDRRTRAWSEYIVSTARRENEVKEKETHKGRNTSRYQKQKH